jgi:thiol-disulfide isomerase/thioredoxin
MRAVRPAATPGLCAVVVLLATLATGQPTISELLRAQDLSASPPGEVPPPFDARTSDGGALSLVGLRGRVVLLTFWATWCAPCREELPRLDRVHRGLAGEGLRVVAVNVREEREAVAEYGRTLGLTLPLVVDPQGAIQLAYGVIALPTTFVIARDGRTVARAIGPRDWSTSQSNALIRALLTEPVKSR